MPYVSVIGAAIMDVIAKSSSRLIGADSNLGKVSQSSGGVGRNIAENLARLGVDVKLVVALGSDHAGKQLLEDCTQTGIDMRHCQIQDGASSTYVAVLDSDGEMAMAIVDDAAKLGIGHMREHSDAIGGSEIIILDANLGENEISAILDMFPGKTFFADAISVTKAQRLKSFLGRFHTIKMNRLEAASLSGMEIADETALEKAGDYFLAEGTKRVIISLGAEGIYYKTGAQQLWFKPDPIVPVNATGAGDALMAGLVYCQLHNKSADYTLRFSHAMAQEALMSEKAVSLLISEHRAQSAMPQRSEEA
ncbi:MAG: carbohydrate kinase family protein [Defluviitaleaceae bacterium]|nr:carbohydrate kinase family protein [Defluviitaleaceae bacterium]